MNFMVLALPRSGTAWSSVWLTDSVCQAYHDPLEYTHLTELASLGRGNWGICCTASWLIPDFVEAFDCRKLILERNPRQVNVSLAALGFPQMSKSAIDRFESLPGKRVPWTDLFTNPKPIWDYLRPDTPFDPVRHEILSRLNIQRDLHDYSPDPALIAELFARVRQK